MKPTRLLACLVYVTAVISGWLYGLHWKNTAQSSNTEKDTTEESSVIREQEEEIELLREENAVLRSLAQGGGDYPISAEQQAFIEDQLGLKFRSTPRVKKASPEELSDAVLGELTHLYGESGLDERSILWGLLGLIPLEQNVRGQFHAVGTEGIRGTLSADGILIAADFDSEHVRDASALVRLLAQLLIDQYLVTPPSASDDTRWAHVALRDGLAAQVTSAFQARQARLLGTLSTGGDSRSAELLASMPTFVQEVILFPPQYSLNYLDSESLTPRELLENPPVSTAQIFRPGYERQAGTLGQLGLYGLLRQSLSAEEALALSSSWQDDLIKYEENSSSWEVTVSTVEDARLIVAAAKTTLEASFPRGEQETLPLFLQRDWKVLQEGNRVVMINNSVETPAF